MMDHAAHEAAALADGVAHHAIAVDGHAAEPPEAAADAVSSPTSAAEPVWDAVEAAGAAVSDATEAAVRPADEATAGAERTGQAARDAPSATADALGQCSAKMFEMMRVNASATTALFAALVQAKSVPEALSLNADHLRRQVETLTSQGRELATLAQRIALDALQPFKDPTDR